MAIFKNYINIKRGQNPTAPFFTEKAVRKTKQQRGIFL